MKSQVLLRIVPVSMCICAVSLPGCKPANQPAATVKQANNPAPQPAATPTPDTAARQVPTTASTAAEQEAAAAFLRDPAEAAKAAPPSQKPISTVQIVKADPPELNLGDIPTNDSASGKVRLVNTGDLPMTVLNARASCGCTALKFAPNTVIPPKGEIEVDVQMNGGPKAMDLHGKTVTFVVEGQPEVVVPLKARAVTFVVSEPANIDPEQLADGKIVLKSIDNQPFQIMSVQPPVVELSDANKTKQAEQEIVVSWDKYREEGVNRQMVVYLDHPKCNQVFMNITWPQQELLEAIRKNQQKNQTNKDALQPTPAMPTPAADPDAMLAQLIEDGKNVEVMQRLQSGLDPNYRDSSGNSLLGIAAKFGNIELMKALLATGKVDVNSTDNVGRTPLMHAGTSKNVEAVRLLVDNKADISTRDNLGTTALSWAAWLGNAQCVTELIEQGSEVEIVSTITGWTPLMLAAAFGEPAAVQALLKVHANVEAVDLLEGATPMIHAARTGQAESLQLLIKAGANLEIPDRNGNTPLLSCAKSVGDAEKLKILLDAGANVKAKDNRGLNALELARKRTDARAADVIKMLEPLLANETPAAASNEPAPAGS